MSERRHSFLEFFCGGGFARAGLGSRWDCELANDIDAKKGRTYAENWGSDRLRVADINELGVKRAWSPDMFSSVFVFLLVFGF